MDRIEIATIIASLAFMAAGDAAILWGSRAASVPLYGIGWCLWGLCMGLLARRSKESK